MRCAKKLRDDERNVLDTQEGMSSNSLAGGPPTISVAPRTWISYVHGPHDGDVYTLACRLRGDGVDCQYDGFVARPIGGWARYMATNASDNDFILIVASEAYLRRFRLEEQAGVGQGVSFESGMLARRVLERQGRDHGVIPMVFDRADLAFIVPFLADETRYVLFEQYVDLHRVLTAQPERIAPPLGVMTSRPPRPAVDYDEGEFARERGDFDRFD